MTGDAIFCQKTITSRIVAKGGDYVLPVKRNQKDLHEEIATAFNEPVFPLAQWHEQPQLGHGRIDQRHIELLPVDALSEYMRNAWPTIRCIARVTRNRQHVRAGIVIKSETEITYLISSMTDATPETILRLNRNHWQIEIMHRDKDVTMGEDHYTNRSYHAPEPSSHSPVPQSLCSNASQNPQHERSNWFRTIAVKPSLSSPETQNHTFSESP